MNNSALLFNMSRLLGKGLFNTLFNLKVEGRENIPLDRKYILISNHLNWSDPFYLYIIFPANPRLIFVAEYEGIYDNIYKKKFIDLMGKPILPIDRDDPVSRISALKSMYKIVKSGEILSVFPEGRLGHREGELFPFHIGVFSISRKLKVPILPIAIAGSKELSFRKTIHIRIGKLINCHQDETDEQFARRSAKVMQKLL